MIVDHVIDQSVDHGQSIGAQLLEWPTLEWPIISGLSRAQITVLLFYLISRLMENQAKLMILTGN